jgi:hypothetical protein
MMSAKPHVSDVPLRSVKDRPGPAAGRARPERVIEGAPAPARQREVRFSDFESVARLKEQERLPKDSLENWGRLWQRNPALAAAKTPPSMGWVLETAEGIVGYQGSLPLLYRLGNRTLVGAVGTGLAIDPAYRARGVGLMSSFYRQRGVDLLFVTFAIDSVTKLSKVLHAKALSQRDYDKVLFWILDARRFTEALAAKFGVGSRMAAVATFLGSSVLRADMHFRRGPKGRFADEFGVAEIEVKDIGDEFEDLWRRKLTEAPRLMVDRSPASLRWHFTIPGGSSRAAVFCCWRSGRMAGYAIVEHSTDRKTGLRRAMLADVLVEQDDPGVTEALIEAAYTNAIASGGDFFEVVGLPGHIRRILMRWNPYVRTLSTDPLVYRTADESLERLLADENGWYAGPMDGDTTLMP